MRRRLAEVARHVGVSEATVSRVLNERPGVSDATRQAVLTALDVLGYERPTQLRGERARLVGLVLPELQNPIFPAFADIVGGALVQQGFTPVLCTRTAGGITEAAYIDLLLEQQVSGVVFAGGLYAQESAPHAHYAKLAERSLPVVLVNAAVDWIGFPRVSCDDTAAGEQAMEHLIVARSHADRPAPRTVGPPALAAQAGGRPPRRRPPRHRDPVRPRRHGAVLAGGWPGGRHPVARRRGDGDGLRQRSAGARGGRAPPAGSGCASPPTSR